MKRPKNYQVEYYQCTIAVGSPALYFSTIHLLSVNLPVTSDSVRGSQSAREKQKGGHQLGVLSPTEKKKLVAQYGDLSNDEDDDVYPSIHSVSSKLFVNYDSLP